MTTGTAGVTGCVVEGGLTVEGVTVGCAVGTVVLLGAVLEPPEPPLQAPQIVTIATTTHKGLQSRVGRVDPQAMAETEFYPAAPTSLARPEIAEAVPVAPQADLAPQAELLSRVDELERVVATIASLRRERMAVDRPDPVALTAALHPGGMRSARRNRRRTSNNGTLPLRFVVFEPPTSR